MWLMNMSLFYPARNELTSHSWFNKVFYATIDDNQYQINHKFNCLHYTLMSELPKYYQWWKENRNKKDLKRDQWTLVKLTTDYGHPDSKLPSLNGRKSTPTPKFLGTAEAYFVCQIGPNFQISLIYAFIGCP